MSHLLTKWRKLEGEALFWFHRLVGRLLRWRIHGRSNLSLAHAAQRPILWTLWHEQVSSFVMYGDRFLDGRNFCLIRVGDARGDILKRMAHRLGAESHAVDMSGNSMAAGRAVLRVIQAMKSGKQTMLAPDGPDGPAFEAKEGVAYLARKSGAVVIPVGTAAWPILRIPRWDYYQIPLPFSTMHIQIGDPILVDKNEDEFKLLQKITDALSTARYRAQEKARISKWP